MKNITFEIYKEEQVGDSLGKINYNALALDAAVCNLSSSFFNVKNNLNSVLNDLKIQAASFEETAKLFYDTSPFDKVSTATNLLSSYWQKHQFSVLYPLNISTLGNLSINNLVANTVTCNQLNSLGLNYLKQNFSTANFIEGTVAYVNFFFYNIASNPYDPNSLIKTELSPEISFTNRYMSARFSREDVHFENGLVVPFIYGRNNWVPSNTCSPAQVVDPPIPPITPRNPTGPIYVPPNTDYTTARFTQSGQFTVPSNITTVEVLVVGGGGGAGYPGNNDGGAGGGGGGVVHVSKYPVTPGAIINVTVGNGGAAGWKEGSCIDNKIKKEGKYSGSKGGNSSFGELIAGGGEGGFGGCHAPNKGGNPGTGNFTGIGGRGFFAKQLPALAGGDGYYYGITGEYFGGGGAGGGWIPQDYKKKTNVWGPLDFPINGGTGGGGSTSSKSSGTDGTPNTGGGGAGCVYGYTGKGKTKKFFTPGAGGSGVVLVTYLR